MKFTELRKINDALRATPGVHDRERIIAKMLTEAQDDNAYITASMLLIGKLTNFTEDLTTGIKEAFVASDLGLEGRQSLEDIAKVAMERAKVGKNDYTVNDIMTFFRSYLKDAGRKSADKSRIISLCLFDLAATKEDVPFLLQILCGKVNNGIDDKLILYAAAGVHQGTYKWAPISREYRDDISRRYSFKPSIGDWLYAMFNPDDQEMGEVMSGKAEPGFPLEPQLCARVDDLAKVLTEHKGMTIVQPKVDGQRLHIHVWRDFVQDGPVMRRVRLFSRTLKDVTEDYPEVVAAAARLPIKKEAILDGELVALEPDGRVAPFEVLQTRLGRKEDKEAVEVGVVVYDLLLYDDIPVAEMPYSDRIDLLGRLVDKNPKLHLLGHSYVAGLTVLKDMLMQAYEDGEEGLVCKDPHSLPEPGQRTKAWIKLKPDYMAEGDFGDTYDLVVIGYNKGRGRRHGKVGALWVALRGTDGFVPVCKVGTGLKDTDLDWFGANLEPRQGTVEEDLAYRDAEIDVLVEPTVVVEVGATGGRTVIDRWAGWSLRFPYFIKVRTDKTPAQATSVEEATQ